MSIIASVAVCWKLWKYAIQCMSNLTSKISCHPEAQSTSRIFLKPIRPLFLLTQVTKWHHMVLSRLVLPCRWFCSFISNWHKAYSGLFFSAIARFHSLFSACVISTEYTASDNTPTWPKWSKEGHESVPREQVATAPGRQVAQERTAWLNASILLRHWRTLPNGQARLLSYFLLRVRKRGMEQLVRFGVALAQGAQGTAVHNLLSWFKLRFSQACADMSCLTESQFLHHHDDQFVHEDSFSNNFSTI